MGLPTIGADTVEDLDRLADLVFRLNHCPPDHSHPR
jgi:hypothetical protein